MAKIVYIGLPAHGHTNPTLPVMKELVTRGHEVLYYNAESFRQKVTPSGVDFRPLPDLMPTAREISEALNGLIDASLLLARISAPLARWLIVELAREAPDLVIYDSVAMWGYVAARTLGIPNICFVTTLVMEGSMSLLDARAVARLIGSALPHALSLWRWRREMAAEFGSDVAGGITEYAERNIVFTSREFQPSSKRIDHHFRFVGPAIDPVIRADDFPYEQLVEGRKVYLSLGTINNLNETFYRNAFAAFADYDAQFILSVGANTSISALGDIPPNFIVCNTVPQLDILQRVHAFVTHGGMNSVQEGLYYGVPEVVVPHHTEQLLNGKRVAQLGAGLLLGEARLGGHVTAAELLAAVNQVMTDSSYRENAARIGTTLREAGGYMQAVAEIEGYVAQLGPLDNALAETGMMHPVA